MLITDIKQETLETTTAEEMGIPYLSKATEAEAEVSEVVKVGIGYIHGLERRTMVSFVVRHPLEFFFMVDSGTPVTYLSIQVRV